MKKRIILSILLCCCLMVTLLSACDDSDTTEQPPADDAGEEVTSASANVFTIDFANGKTDFLMINSSYPTSDFGTTIEVAQIGGQSALAITTPGGGEARIGINVGGLLGSSITEASAIVFDVEAQYPDGNFGAVGGKVLAMSGETSAFAETEWTIYMESRNPREVMLEFGSGFTAEGPNLVEFQILNNVPADRGETPAVVYIKSISLVDSEYTTLMMDTNAGWAAPDGYGESSLANWELPVTGPTVAEAKFFEFYTWGLDGDTGLPTAPDNRNTVGTDDYLPYEILAASYGIVFVMDAEPSESIVLINNSAFNGWGWNQNDDQLYSYADGELSIMWRNTEDVDTTKITPDSWAVKLRIGSWSEEFTNMVSAAYLIYDADKAAALGYEG